MRQTPEYRTWLSVRNRCNNPKAKDFDLYGGRGIAICSKWDSFPAFLSDVGTRPSQQHSIDRIDSNGHYEPGNVRWASSKEQARNTRRNRFVLYLGQRVCIAEAAELSGIPPDTLKQRVRRGWDSDRLFLSVR
jgi:hypothetical protein